MKTAIKCAGASLVLFALTACHGAVPAEETSGQLVRIDPHTKLSIALEGADANWSPVASSNGGPVERVLQSADGKVLFAYGIEASKAEDGTYRLTLKPAATGPTFRTSRVVNVKPGQESVRVELMARPGTGEKIADVFQLKPSELPKEMHVFSFTDHLKRAHQMLFNWMHGQ